MAENGQSQELRQNKKSSSRVEPRQNRYLQLALAQGAWSDASSDELTKGDANQQQYIVNRCFCAGLQRNNGQGKTTMLEGNQKQC